MLKRFESLKVKKCRKTSYTNFFLSFARFLFFKINLHSNSIKEGLLMKFKIKKLSSEIKLNNLFFFNFGCKTNFILCLKNSYQLYKENSRNFIN